MFPERTRVCIAQHRDRWVVLVREANFSAFNGGRRTPSAYSLVRCGECGRCWRTKAAYVATLPDASPTSERTNTP